MTTSHSTKNLPLSVPALVCPTARAGEPRPYKPNAIGNSFPPCPWPLSRVPSGRRAGAGVQRIVYRLNYAATHSHSFTKGIVYSTLDSYSFKSFLCGILLLLTSAPLAAQPPNGAVPLIGYWPLEPGQNNALTDAGPNQLNGTLRGVRAVPGVVGQAAQFEGNDFQASVGNNDFINGTGGALSLTFWVKLDTYPAYGNGAVLIAKRDQNVAAPFITSIGHNGELGFEGNNGANWDSNFFTGGGVVPLKQWVHIAFTFKANSQENFYVNGKHVGSKAVGRALAANDQSLNFGRDAMTEPLPAIGIMYVNDQALLRHVDQNNNGKPEGMTRGDHEGKVTAGLFLCHAAGWPAKVITPEELQRGLPASMKAILLVGLNQFDNTWSWLEGLTPALQKFTQGGGCILLDDESVCPVDATKTGMIVRSYVTQSDMDWTPQLISRNADNMTKLRAAMQGVPLPLATSSDPTIWAVPTVAGDTQYVTVVNQGSEAGKSASKYVKPQTGKLAWNTNRPIYDVRLGRKLTPGEAASVDLTKDAFQYYALPPAEVTAPKVVVKPGMAGFVEVTVTIGNDMRGIPVQLTVTQGAESAIIYGASGTPIKLPLQLRFAARIDNYKVEAKELLMGLTNLFDSATRLGGIIGGSHYNFAAPIAVDAFTVRKQPLNIALTPQQANDSTLQGLAQQLEDFYTKQGRTVKLGRIEPNDVVLSLQPYKSIQAYPRWKTIDADLVLLGNPSNNLLIADQARGYLLPANALALQNGQAAVDVTYSPFIGEYQALNIMANDVAGLTAGVKQVTTGMYYSRVGANVGF